MSSATQQTPASTRHQAPHAAWADAAQNGEFAFHSANDWRRSPRFAVDNAKLWEHFGFRANQFCGQTVVDVGAGSRLRTRYFENARIVAIEPLAERYRMLDFCDLHEATRYFSLPAEELVVELVGRADLVVSINALDHGYDFDRAIQNISAYLKPNALAFLSFDLHDEADELHPLLLTASSCRQVFAAEGLSVVLSRRHLGLLGPHYGHGEAINFWLLRGSGAEGR